ncbi:hypothetical protein M9458_054169, partial [Cirrhinus mrigala]
MVRALKHYLPDLRGHHVLVRTDNTLVVYYINRQVAPDPPLVSGGGAPLEKVRPGGSGFIHVAGNDTSSTLVLPHPSSSAWAGCHGAAVAEASSVPPNALLPGVLERVRQ